MTLALSVPTCNYLQQRHRYQLMATRVCYYSRCDGLDSSCLGVMGWTLAAWVTAYLQPLIRLGSFKLKQAINVYITDFS